MRNVRLVQGNEACALGALKAGATFFAGYPITPSTEIAEFMAEWMPKQSGVFMQMEDEIASIGAVIGASATGAKAFTATSGPGFSLMQELLGYASITEIPCVVVDVQRMGPSTGLPTLSSQGDIQQARWGSHGDRSVIAISPNSVVETYYQTIKAFNLAEKYRTPVILLLEEEIGHLRERFDVDPDEAVEVVNRKAPDCPLEAYLPYENTDCGVPAMPAYGQGYRYHITGLTHNEKGFYSSALDVVDRFNRRLSAKIEDHAADICEYQEYNVEDSDVLLIAYGSVARSAQEAMLDLREEGCKAGLFRPITIWPLHEEAIRKAAAGKKAVIVPEMNLGQYAREIRRILPSDIEVLPLCRVDSELITPDEICSFVKEVL